MADRVIKDLEMNRLNQVLICSMMLVNPLMPAPLVPSDLNNPSQSFTFPVLAHTFNQETSLFLVGANQAVADNNFALAGAYRTNNQFYPLAPKTVNLDDVADQSNPLHGAKINHLTLMGSIPLVVTNGLPNQLLALTDLRSDHMRIISSGLIPDMNGLASAGIVGVVGTVFGQDLVKRSYVAVRNNAGVFGASGSGIWCLNFGPTTIGEGDDAKTIHRFILFTPGMPIDTTTAALAITSPIVSINNDAEQKAVAMHIDRFGNLYTGLLATGAAGATDGVRAVILSGNKAIVNASAVTADSIVAAVGSSVTVSIQTVKTMYTSTNLDYLIVQGGVGTVDETRSQIFALPLINDPDQADSFGTLANKNALPVDKYNSYPPYLFEGRVFQQAATQPGDLFTSSDAPARVGGSVILPGSVTDLQVVADTIYATVAPEGGDVINQSPGVFYSQALFDAYGRIKAWTNWQRAGTQGNFFGLAVDSGYSQFWVLQGADSSNVFNVRRTEWGTGDSMLSGAVSERMPAGNYGVQGLVDIPYQHPAFDQTVGNRLSLAIATGNKRVLILQTGQDESGIFTPNGLYNPVFESTNGTLQGFATPARLIDIQGGVLDNLQAIVTSALASDGTNGWIVVGGFGGVAVLAQNDGTGFTVGLQKDLVGFHAALAFRRLANLTQVKKIIAINERLYVLTGDTLYRFTLTPAAIVNNEEPVILAQAAELESLIFEDIRVSGDLALLATSSGLWRVGDGRSISTAIKSEDINWQRVILNESPGPVTRLYAHSPTALETEFVTSGVGGMVEVLAGYPGYHQARIYRFTLQPGTITENTVQQLPDLFIKNLKTFYINIGNYRNNLFTDGGFYLLSRSRYNPISLVPTVFALPWQGRIGDHRFAGRYAIAQSPLDILASVNTIVRRSSQGGLMVAHDGGLLVNE